MYFTNFLNSNVEICMRTDVTLSYLFLARKSSLETSIDPQDPHGRTSHTNVIKCHCVASHILSKESPGSFRSISSLLMAGDGGIAG